MASRRILSAAALAASFASVGVIVLPDANGATNQRETLFLNTFQSAAHNMSSAACLHDLRCGSRVRGTMVLQKGTPYTITVVGAVSVSGPGIGGRYACGAPQPKPEFQTPGTRPQPANVDAQFIFAEPLYGPGQHCPRLPLRSDAFVIKLSRLSHWVHPVAVGRPTRPSKDFAKSHEQHPYTFAVIGEGSKPNFRFEDFHPSDNDGEFRIQIVHAPHSSKSR
jgi:hypothetical protein